jgi:hypothetical protein
MSFSERRYEFQGAGAPIFGIQQTPWVELKASVPIIPNIEALRSPTFNNWHIPFQKTTCPACGEPSAGNL